MKKGEKGEKKSLKDSVSMSGGLNICSMQLHLFLNISSVHKWGKSCHDMCPWSCCDSTGKSETQSSKKELASGRGIKLSSPRLTALLFHLTVSLPSGNAAAPGP